MSKKLEFNFPDTAYRYLISLAELRGITKRQLALSMGIEPQNITNTLARGNVKVSSLKKMANVLDVEIKISLTAKKINHGKSKEKDSK